MAQQLKCWVADKKVAYASHDTASLPVLGP